MLSEKIRIWVEGAIIASLAMTLSLLPTSIGSSFSVSLGMIPLVLYALRRGFIPGLYAGLLWGLLHFLLGQVYFLSMMQVFIEYIIAFTFVGFSGLYSSKVVNKSAKVTGWIFMGTFVGTFARYFWHFIAGVIFWGEYAPDNLSPVVFSFVMNGLSGLTTGIVAAVVISWLVKMYPKILSVR